MIQRSAAVMLKFLNRKLMKNRDIILKAVVQCFIIVQVLYYLSYQYE